jgi:hypothetical protein
MKLKKINRNSNFTAGEEAILEQAVILLKKKKTHFTSKDFILLLKSNINI